MRGGHSTLYFLRREAGYTNAATFAQAVSIPASTYSRYEKHPDRIPVQAAWLIADSLGCSIDVVVGRRGADAPDTDPLRIAFNDLSAGSRAMWKDYLGYLRYRDAQAAAERRR